MRIDVGDLVKRALTENLNLKLLSLAFALVLYSLVHGQQDAQRVMFVDIVRVPPPENRVLTTDIPARVRVLLRGPRSQLDELRADELGTVQIDLHTGTEKRVTIEPKMVHVPPGITVEQIDPPVIELSWEDVIVRDVPIQVSVVGTPATGFVVKGAPVASPKAVRAQGPRSEVLVLQHVRADAFDVAGLTEGTYTRNLALDKPPGRVTYTPNAVTVTAEVTREIVERHFAKMPVVVVGQAKAKTTPAEVDVRLMCPPEVLRGLRSEQVVPRVEVTSKDPTGSVSQKIEVQVADCQARVTPESVVVRW
jgi:YbbR domain-containing protein